MMSVASHDVYGCYYRPFRTITLLSPAYRLRLYRENHIAVTMLTLLLMLVLRDGGRSALRIFRRRGWQPASRREIKPKT